MRKCRNDKDFLDEKKICIALMSSFGILTLQYLILVFFNLLDTPRGNNIQLISKVIVGLFYLIALPVVLKRNKIKLIVVYLVAIFVFTLNFLFFNDNWPYLKSIIFSFFFICLPSFIYAYSINDWNVLKNVMRKTSLLVFFIGSVIGILVFSNKISIGDYSMSFSYYMLLPIIIYLDELLSKFTLKSMFISGISLLIILALGSRGAILCIGIFVMLKLINITKKLDFKTILIYFILILSISSLLIFKNQILEILYVFLMRFGINSRSIYLFLKGGVNLSGRDYLYETVLQEIADSPFFGIGLAGDRRIIGGGYVHNIFIELIANFGIIFGGAVILLLCILSYKGLFNKNKNLSNLMTVWFSVGFVHLMVSSSYIIDFRFWIFVGLISKFAKRKDASTSLLKNGKPIKCQSG